MILAVILLLLTFTRGATMNNGESCSDGLKRCLNIYIGDVMQHIKDTEICQDVSVFVRCILDLDCDLSRDVKVQSFDTVESGLAEKGLKCDKISELRATYLTGVSKSRSRSRSQSTSAVNLKSNSGQENDANMINSTAMTFLLIFVPVISCLC